MQAERAREICEYFNGSNYHDLDGDDIKCSKCADIRAKLEAYGQAVERATRERCAKIAEGFHCPDTCEKELFKGQYEKELKDHECLCESVKIAAAIRGDGA